MVAAAKRKEQRAKQDSISKGKGKMKAGAGETAGVAASLRLNAAAAVFKAIQLQDKRVFL